ncbi:MAG: hypothetical protein EOM64_06885 [Erysipelotrichia bacterium]|nr:hypothetical protein [Erysipelotrichia bacterium]
MKEAIKHAVDQELHSVSILSDQQKHRLRECYLQSNTVESTACKLSLDPLIIRTLFCHLNISLSRNALEEVLTRAGQHGSSH